MVYGRRLTKEQFTDRTLVRWKAGLDQPWPGGGGGSGVRRVAARDADLVRFVYDQLQEEYYTSGMFPDASDEEVKAYEEGKPTSRG